MMPKHADGEIGYRRRGRVAGHRNRRARSPQILQLACASSAETRKQLKCSALAAGCLCLHFLTCLIRI